MLGCRTQSEDEALEARNSKTVVAVILGGGAGTRLFPLTKRRAKPAVGASSSSLAKIITKLKCGTSSLSLERI